MGHGTSLKIQLADNDREHRNYVRPDLLVKNISTDRCRHRRDTNIWGVLKLENDLLNKDAVFRRKANVCHA